MLRQSQKRRKIPVGQILLVLLFSMFSANAFALDMEYHCYNGFDPIVTAFQKVALIFGANDYRGLFFSMAVAGVLFGGMFVYLKVFMGGRLSLGAWATPFFLGVILYLGLIVPTGNLTIQDDVLNRFQIVQGVPDGIVALAGVTNLIERSIIEIIDLVGAPNAPNYKESAGGIGFDLLMSATGGDISGKTPNAYMTASLDRYIRDCVTFEIQRPGSQINLDTLLNSTVDIRTQLAQANSPSIFTVFFDAANPQGLTQSCQSAWTNLNAYLVDMNFNQSVSEICSNAGMDVTDINEMTSCQSIVAKHISFFTNNGATPHYLIIQSVLSNMINDAILYADPDTAAKVLANKNQVSTGVGLGLMASEWLPVARAVVTAVAVGLVPFVVLLIPTPLSGRALQLLTGFFIWLTAWGVTDAVVNSFAVSQAFNLFDSIRTHNYSMVSMMMFPNAAVKAYAMFGMIRTAGIGLATVMTAMLIRFGGSALAHLAGSITASIQSHGGGSGRAMGTPEGIAREIRETNMDVPVMANALSYDWNSRTVSQGNQLDHGTGGGLGWGSRENAFATGFGSTAVSSAVQQQKISDSGGFREWVQNEAVTGGMAVMSGAGKRVTWDTGMNEFRNDYLRENPHASVQEVRMSGSQFFGSFLNPEKGLEAYRALKDRGVQPSGAFNEMVGLGSFTTEKGYAFTEAQIETIKTYAKQHGMTPSQALSTWGEFDVANAAAMMDAFKTPESYKSFRTMAYGLDAAQQRGIIEAARHAGYDPADTVQTASFLKHMETIGALQMYKEGRLRDQDLLLIGSARVLTEKGLAHARENISRMTGMGIDKVEEYMRTREGLMTYARFDNMEQFARRHGQSFLELARDSQRSMNLDLDGKTAAVWGLPGAGHYAVSWGGKGGYVFTDRKSGSQYQIGVFGQSGRSEFVHDEKGTVIFHGSNATYGDKEEFRDFRGRIGDTEFTRATLEIRGNTFTAYGHIKGEGWGSVSGQTWKDATGKRTFLVEKSLNESQRDTTSGGALTAILVKGVVPVSSMVNDQARYSFAAAFVAEMRKSRSESYVGSNVSDMGVSGSAGVRAAGSGAGVSASIARQDTSREDVNKQMKAALKIMYKYDNDEVGRKAAADDLRKLFDSNARQSSTYMTEGLSNINAAKPWSRKR